MLAFGLVGAGEQGRTVLLPAALSNGVARILAVCDTDADKARMAAAQINGTPYTDFRAMISECNLAGLVMACPPRVHYEVAKFALSRGLHVFVEKPPAVSSGELIELAEIAHERALITGVGLNFRRAEPILQLKSYLEERKLTPSLIAVKHTASKPKKDIWNIGSTLDTILLAQAIHPLDTILNIGGAVARVDALGTEPNGWMLSVNIVFESGAIGHLLTGSGAPNFENRIEVFTMQGPSLVVDDLRSFRIIDPDALPTGLSDKKRWSYEWRPSPTNCGFSRPGYSGELAEFFMCVDKNEQFSPSFRDTIPIYKIMTEISAQIVKSAR